MAYNDTYIAVLLTTCDKYTPGKQTFRIQSLVGLKENSNQIEKTENQGKKISC